MGSLLETYTETHLTIYLKLPSTRPPQKLNNRSVLMAYYSSHSLAVYDNRTNCLEGLSGPFDFSLPAIHFTNEL